MRLFVALSISADVRQQLSLLVDELRQADSKPRWVNPANLHITLKFIGQVPAESLAAIRQSLAAVVVPQLLPLRFRGLGFFPNDRRPSVLWAGLDAPPGLAELAGHIDEALSACGIPREIRPFAAHLTLARFKETHLSEGLRAVVQKSRERSFGEMTARQFHLMESRLRSTGAEYTTLDSFRLAGEGTEQ
jgi:RNA 2',3'-cyclic 3'-phosphodiesterase